MLGGARMRKYGVPLAGGVLAALAVAGLAVLVRTSAGPGTLTAQFGPGATATAVGPGLGDDAGGGFGSGPGLGDDAGTGTNPGLGPGQGGGDNPAPGTGVGPGLGDDGGGGDPGGGLTDDAGLRIGGDDPGDGGLTGPGGPAPGDESGGREQPPQTVADPPEEPEPPAEETDPEKLCLAGVVVADPADHPGLVADCSVLLRAKDELRGTASLGWSGDQAIADWDGVTVSGSPPRVTGIELRRKGLNGSLPAGLGALSELTVLRLDANRLTGAFPAEIGNLSKLTVLATRGGNRFSDAHYPASLGGLTAMRDLNLTGGHTGGPIPDLSGMTRLEVLRLANNVFTGTLPAWLGGFARLRSLTLHGNLLSGEIPPELAHLTALRELSLDKTFSGCLPPGLKDVAPGRNGALLLGLPDCEAAPAAASACTNGLTVPGHALKPALVADCTALLAAKAALEGEDGTDLGWGGGRLLHEWKGVEVEGTPPRVVRLGLNGLGLAGTIPAELGLLGGLRHLELRRNRLGGSIPAELGGLGELRRADFANNRLGGEIPAELGEARSLESADFALNPGFEGCAPDGLQGKARNLPADMVWCGSGEAVHPPPLARVTESSWRDAAELAAAGIAPSDCPDGPSAPAAGGGPCIPARHIAACSNGIAVPDPDAREGLVRDCALMLDAKDALRGEAPLDWSASVPVADWEGVSVRGGPARVTGIHLRNKEMRGVIPPQLGYLTELEYLHVGAINYLAGPIPRELGLLTKLKVFFAGGRNRLTGTIPAELGNLTGLEVLYLSNNRLTGTVPRLGPNLRHLELRGNRLGGPLPEWLGEAAKLRLLILHNNNFAGSIPRGLGRLPRLRNVTLSRNALTGCVPSAFEDIRSDAARLGLPWCLRYDNLDATGTVASAGSWAVLDGGGGEGAPPAVLTTWEGLRSGAATLRVHETDAGGSSWASEFGAVAANDLFEWRKADDCWVRYRVTGAPAAPPNSPGRWEFPIEWMTYAATGAGCEGAVGAGAVLRVDEAAPSVIPATAITSPVRHGAYLVYPQNWTGAREPKARYEPLPADTSGGASGSDGDSTAADPEGVYTNDPAEARRRISRWRDPALPAGWTFRSAESPDGRGYKAIYLNELGYDAVRIYVYYRTERPGYFKATLGGGWIVYEPRVLDGRAALVVYSPQGATHERLRATSVWIFDADTGIEYYLRGVDRNLLGSNIEPLVEIARSLLLPVAPR